LRHGRRLESMTFLSSSAFSVGSRRARDGKHPGT
jgi:hypothetical protein